jgi:hypothetical protein
MGVVNPNDRGARWNMLRNTLDVFRAHIRAIVPFFSRGGRLTALLA